MSLCLNIKPNTNDDYLQLDDLYVEILYTILHMIGCEVKQEEQVELIIHLKNVFHMAQKLTYWLIFQKWDLTLLVFATHEDQILLYYDHKGSFYATFV